MLLTESTRCFLYLNQEKHWFKKKVKSETDGADSGKAYKK